MSSPLKQFEPEHGPRLKIVSDEQSDAVPLDLPGPRVWMPEDMAKFLRVGVDWVYKHANKNADDSIPRIQGIGRVRFDTKSPLFQAWMRKHLGYEE